MGLLTGDAQDLSQAGWGIIFAANDPRVEAVRAALRPLLELRRAQAGHACEHFYREFCRDRGYQEGDTKRRFLSRHGVGPGAADPDRMPFYLLIVGDPETIPYEFQYHLDIQYAVGRIYFETIDAYADYARNVVAAETCSRGHDRTVAFFAPQHPGDSATELSATQLAARLAEYATHQSDWKVKVALRDDATKARLQELLAGEEELDLLFTAGHGMVFRHGHPLQTPCQGAVVCRDWVGGGMAPEFYFSGDDLSSSQRLHGLIAFHFGCYSAGTPAWADVNLEHERRPVAPKPFISHLSLRLLQAGALAVIGHIGMAWRCSIEWPGAGTHIQVFKEALGRLLLGYRVGMAMDSFGQRYAELASELSAEFERIWQGDPLDDEQLKDLWTSSHDTRNYIVLGDPAVRFVIP